MERSDYVKFPGDDGYVAPGSEEHGRLITGSRVGDILGVGYKTPMERWMIMTGRMGDDGHKRIYDRGHDMEPIIMRHMGDDHGRKIDAAQVQFQDPARPWLMVHADGVIPEYTPLDGGTHMGFGGLGVFEAKAPGSRTTAMFRECGLPGHYVAQGQIGMHVASAALGAVVDYSCYAFLDYDEYETVPFDIPRSGEYVTNALQFIDHFWDCVEKDTPPRDLNPLDLGPLPRVDGEVVLLESREKIEAARQFVEAAMIRKESMQHYDEQKAVVREALGHGKFNASGIGKVNILPREGKKTLKAKALAAYCRSLCDQMGVEFDEAMFTTTGDRYDDVRCYPDKEYAG